MKEAGIFEEEGKGEGAAYSLYEGFIWQTKITLFLFFAGGLLPLIPHELFEPPEFRFGSTVSFSLTSFAQEDCFRWIFMSGEVEASG